MRIGKCSKKTFTVKTGNRTSTLLFLIVEGHVVFKFMNRNEITALVSQTHFPKYGNRGVTHSEDFEFELLEVEETR